MAEGQALFERAIGVQQRGALVARVQALGAGARTGPPRLEIGVVLQVQAAHAGERTLDVEGPNFRAASLAGAILAAVIFLGIVYLVNSLKDRKRVFGRHQRRLFLLPSSSAATSEISSARNQSGEPRGNPASATADHSYAVDTAANASVTIAKYTPRNRRIGTPIRIEATAQKTPATGSVHQKDQP